MAKVLYSVETLPKISIVWVGRTNVTDRRQTTDGRTTTYSEHELEFTFAKNWSGADIALFWTDTMNKMDKLDEGAARNLPLILKRSKVVQFWLLRPFEFFFKLGRAYVLCWRLVTFIIANSIGIQLLTLNNLGWTWRRICSPDIRNVSALEMLLLLLLLL